MTQVWLQIFKIILVEEQVDAIVNPANGNLKHGGGAAKAIANAAGDEFNEECKAYIEKYEKLDVGEALVTSAGGTLKCKNVIHVVGPDLRGKK